jgi:hypothetical protein
MTHDQLVAAIKSLVPAAMEISGYTIAVDSSGDATIATWDASLGTQPTTTALTTALTAIQLQQAQVAQVAILMAAYASAGYAPVAYMGSAFPSDPNTLLLLSCTLVQGSTPQGLPSGFQWYSDEGTGVPMTLVQLQGLGNAIFAQVYAAYGKVQGLIQAVETATTVAAVQAIVWS